MLQSHFLGLHTLGILLLYSIRVLGATKPSLCILCTILLRWICRCICWPFRDNQGRFRSTLIHDSIKRSDVALAQDNLLWQLKVIVRDILDIVNLSRLLQTLLIWWCTSSKRPFQIKLSCILIFGWSWMNPDNGICIEAMIAFPVTVAWILSVYWWSYIGNGSRRLMMSIWINC